VPRAERLAVIASHLQPAAGFGGVAVSTSTLIKAWRAAGRVLEVVCSDGTRGAPLSRADFERELLGPVRTYRAMIAVRWAFGLGAPAAIARAIAHSDGAYISGIATWPTTLAALLARLLKRPYVVATRGGMMDEHWRVIAAHRPLKALFYRLLVFPSLRRATAVHATSVLEAEGILAVLPGARVFIAPNVLPGAGAGEPVPAPPLGEGLVLLYLGRMSPEKGILGFARAFLTERQAGDRLLIAGQPQSEYGAAVVSLCQDVDGLDYLGLLDRPQTQAAIAAAHAIVLPSGLDGDTRENFGNVVLEALQQGRPSLTTRGLAWDDMEAAQAGVTFGRDGSDLTAALDSLRRLCARPDIRERCAVLARDRFQAGPVADLMWLKVFGDGDVRERGLG
jgi:glycosyltransferase involved in cell wall biosynthesis